MTQEIQPYRFFKNRGEITTYLQQQLISTWTDKMEGMSHEGDASRIELVIADLKQYFADAMRPESSEGWLTIAAAAAHLGITPKALYKWVAVHGCPAYRVGSGLRSALRFRLSELDQWMHTQRVAKRVTITLSQGSIKRTRRLIPPIQL